MRAITDDEVADRRAKVLTAARWCFLNFGFAKTSFDDIARRAGMSRTLLYRLFRDKDDIYRAVFVDWLVSRRPAAEALAAGPGTAHQRLLEACRLLVLEPWSDMSRAPMGGDFMEACRRIDPTTEALYRQVSVDCIAAILRDREAAEVFVLALDGLCTDEPSSDVLESRIAVLVARFAPSTDVPSRRGRQAR